MSLRPSLLSNKRTSKAVTPSAPISTLRFAKLCLDTRNLSIAAAHTMSIATTVRPNVSGFERWSNAAQAALDALQRNDEYKHAPFDQRIRLLSHTLRNSGRSERLQHLTSLERKAIDAHIDTLQSMLKDCETIGEHAPELAVETMRDILRTVTAAHRGGETIDGKQRQRHRAATRRTMLAVGQVAVDRTLFALIFIIFVSILHNPRQARELAPTLVRQFPYYSGVAFRMLEEVSRWWLHFIGQEFSFGAAVSGVALLVLNYALDGRRRR